MGMLEVVIQIGQKRGPPIEDAAQPVEKNIRPKGQAQNRVRDDDVGSFLAGNILQPVHRAGCLAHKSSTKFSNPAAPAQRHHGFSSAQGREQNNFDSVAGRKKFYTTRSQLASLCASTHHVAQASACGVFLASIKPHRLKPVLLKNLNSAETLLALASIPPAFVPEENAR